MPATELRACLNNLETLFEPEQAVARTKAEGNNVVIEGNQHGLMSVAISLLNAAAEPPCANSQIPNLHSCQLNQIIQDKDDLIFLGAIHRADLKGSISPPRVNRKLSDRYALVGCAILAFVLCLIGGGGILFWIQLFMRA